ncbi:hypothetical protein JTB14_028796 [Gonioctena quinquepunctata]|nr:hypothetical protein JTB14_028796 [Gonioctena quinquepunctata]
MLRFLHISDNKTAPKEGDIAFDKPTKNLAVDESMVAFKGRTSLKQYMPQKPIKGGIEVWAIACAKTRYLLHLSVNELVADKSLEMGNHVSVNCEDITVSVTKWRDRGRNAWWWRAFSLGTILDVLRLVLGELLERTK